MAQRPPSPPYPENKSKANESFFRKLENLPTPNLYRAASGAPGHRYWQQQVDYKIRVSLDDEKQKVSGTEDITYHNNSPDELRYLWLQLDQNIRKATSTGANSRSAPNLEALAGDDKPGVPGYVLRSLASKDNRDGHVIHAVKDATGKDLPFTVVDTMMRVDLPVPLKPGQVLKFSVAWDYVVNNYKNAGGRSGVEQLEDGARLYNIAQWQPRLVAYTDDMGWQHQQFLGQGEFTLEFGDWDVEITVPWDFTILATGELQNPQEVLTAAQRDRLMKARSASKPLFIVAPEEAGKGESRPTKSGTSVWKFKAANVRDFAWNTCRRQIWDAMGVDVNGRTVLAMSGYTKEGMPLWDKYSTAAVAHTLRVYGRYTFDYPYPVAISCLGLGGGGGMEYPMLCFNGPRPEKDGTYSERTKHGLVGVVIHEVGHNFFPMIVNSDERQWSWMDEGFNTFLQYLAEKEWNPDFPTTRSIVQGITDYLKFPDATPIMTQSDAVRHFGPNAYQKPAAGFNMLRETIMGRELFDFAFKEYARRWKFKRPQPADFFRSMNDASGLDLDWFWRGWFYMTLAPDLAVENVELFRLGDLDPAKAKERQREADARRDQNISKLRDKTLIPEGGAEKAQGYQDFYTDGSYDRYAVTAADRQKVEAATRALAADEKEWLGFRKNIYRITFRNAGKFPMPIIARLEFKDGSSEVLRLPAQAWLMNEERFSKLVATDKELTGVELDPFQEIPDIDRGNDVYARRIGPAQILNLGRTPPRQPNPMQEKEAEKKKSAQGSAGTETGEKVGGRSLSLKGEEAKAARDGKKPEEKKPETGH
ncbi:MAG: M1 family metallopeptidase [Holophagaceae bacterium]|nr:M1 family metallopeptidase [Holophagaceae bacterium]